MINKSQATEWEIVDNSDAANPKQIARVEAETGKDIIKVVLGFQTQLGHAFDLPSAYAEDFANVLTEAAVVAKTPIVSTAPVAK